MGTERFGKFVLLIDGVHKSVQKLKLKYSPAFGLKGVHSLWMYELLRHPEGMTASELAATSMIDRSLISREIKELKDLDYIKVEGDSSKRNYNMKISLTESGKQVALDVESIALSIQELASVGLEESEIADFYVTLEKIFNNLSKIADESDTVCSSNQAKLSI